MFFTCENRLLKCRCVIQFYRHILLESCAHWLFSNHFITSRRRLQLLCRLEITYCPSFFDVMLHLTINLPTESSICWALQYHGCSISKGIYSLVLFTYFFSLLYLSTLFSFKLEYRFLFKWGNYMKKRA